MKEEYNQGSAESILVAFYACFSRGNLEISSKDPVSLALYLGCSQLLDGWYKHQEGRPNNGQEGL